MWLNTAVIFLLILSVLVIAHELGHFLTARSFKMKVREFGLGFPPKVIKLFRFWDTDFVLNLIPLGGYVGLEGENEVKSATSQTSTEDKKFYQHQPWQRFIVIAAGPLVNFLLAMVIFAVVFGMTGIPQKTDSKVFIDMIEPESPAAKAGLLSQTQILSLADQQGHYLQVQTQEEAINFIKANQGQTVTIVTSGQCQKGQCQEIARVAEVYVRLPEEKPDNAGAVGIGLSEYEMVFYPGLKQVRMSIFYGVKQSWELAMQMIGGLFEAAVNVTTGVKSDTIFMGPVGIVAQIQQQQAFEEGLLAILSFMGLLSLNLGVINLLPFPALDGGRLLLIGLEKVLGRKKIAKVEMGLNYVGFVCLMGLMLIITGQDIWRLIKGL